ncbi:MAG: hypothetical protein ACJA07_004485 [Rhodococcus sp. (in: high G+C Gram-positive bacteria)]
MQYGAAFDLAAEISAIIEPLAKGVASDPVPGAMRDNVADLAEAVHRCVGALTDIVGASGDGAKVAHLAAEDRSRALRLIREHRAGRGRPQIDDAALIAGIWHTDLVEPASAISGDLAAFLGRSRRYDADGLPSASQRVESELREVDRAALSLSRRIARRLADREMFGNRPEPTVSPAAELVSMGVEL